LFQFPLSTESPSVGGDSMWVMMDLAVDLGGLIIILLGFYLFVRGMFLFGAVRRNDTYFLKEYASKRRLPFELVVLGVALCVSGFIVVFVPFSTYTPN